MPSLGADMEAGTVLEWRIHPGDSVHRGDIVAVVDTEKADIDVEIFEDGVVEELLVEVGERVPVGTPLARLAPAGGPRERGRKRRAAAVPARAEPRPATPAAEGHVRASPLARRRAAAAGVALGDVRGTGPAGAVVGRDLDAAAPAPAPARSPAPVADGAPDVDRHAAMRQAIGQLMARSKREIPHYYLATTIDLSTATAWLQERNAARPVTERVLPAALLLKATALAARRMPAFNGWWEDGFHPADAVHLGVAVSLRGGGLIAPVLRDADGRALDELMADLRGLIERARAGRLRSSEMSEPTLTVTNLGDQGAEEVLGVIYPPQVALVGFGRIVDRPWADGGMLGVRPVVRATLAADHRATDGHAGSAFLATIDHLLHAPEEL
jgi:pyruvate dehydrogenase E2 component (dihydrolipoamide acetyltransferase)